MARTDRTICDHCALQFDREAGDRERMADRPGSQYTDAERRLLRAQATIYRACAQTLRLEARKVSRG